jgi:hypothetical protein
MALIGCQRVPLSSPAAVPCRRGPTVCYAEARVDAGAAGHSEDIASPKKKARMRCRLAG